MTGQADRYTVNYITVTEAKLGYGSAYYISTLLVFKFQIEVSFFIYYLAPSQQASIMDVSAPLVSYDTGIFKKRVHYSL